MKKHIIRLSLVLLLIMGLASNAAAIPITGSISFAGGGGTNNDGNLTLATAFTSFTNVSLQGKAGSYNAITTIDPPGITFSAFTFLPSFPAAGVTPLWTFVSGGLTYSFDATSLMFLSSSEHFLNVRGTGIAHITGFEDTLSTWSITATHEGQYAFGSSAEAVVPEPLTLILLGSGLLGLAGLRRRLSK